MSNKFYNRLAFIRILICSRLVKSIVFLLLVILSLNIAFPAQAALCRTTQERSICITRIKRSAKNYWEYRASVRIEKGKTREIRPIEIYNCRDRVRIPKNGRPIPFETKGAGEWICSYFQ